jgi:hypothetical protein
MVGRIAGILGTILEEERLSGNNGDSRFCIAMDPKEKIITILVVPGLVGQRIEVRVVYDVKGRDRDE